MSRRFESQNQKPEEGAGHHSLAEMLHRGAIGLLRGIKVADQETGISPPRLSALIMAMLAKDPAERPAGMHEVIAELELALRDTLDEGRMAAWGKQAAAVPGWGTMP